MFHHGLVGPPPGYRKKPKTIMCTQSGKRPIAPLIYRPQASLKPVQLKMANGAFNRKAPVASPVYGPQPAPKVLQTKRSSALKPQPSQALRQPIAPPVYRSEAEKIIQQKATGALRKLPTPPPVYRPEQKRIAQPKMATALKTHMPPNAPPVYRPPQKLVSAQPKTVGLVQMRNHPPASPVYRPQPVPKVLQTITQQGHNRGTAPSPPVAQLARFPRNGQSAATVQRFVDRKTSDVSYSGKYFVKHADSTVLYSTKDADPPQPVRLYARGEDYTEGKDGHINLNSWRPNVRFINTLEKQAQPVVNKPGTYRYKTPGFFGGTVEYSIGDLQRGVENPVPGLDGPPTIGALGKNDCNIWATTLQNLIGERSNYDILRGRQEQRTVAVQSPATTRRDLNVDVGDRMRHIYQGDGLCRYHAATVVAKDGPSLVTLEGHVSMDLSRPQFHIRDGLAGFAAEGIAHGKGDNVEVIPVASLSRKDIDDDIEARERRFLAFNDIDPVFWRDYEAENYSYRGRLRGDIGITLSAERRRQLKAYDAALTRSLSMAVDEDNPGIQGSAGNGAILNDML